MRTRRTFGAMGALALVTLVGAAPDSGQVRDVSWEEVRAFHDSLLHLPDSLLRIPGAPGYMTPSWIRQFARRFLYAPDSIYAGPDSAHRTDAEMKAVFMARERDFERLVRMFQADSAFDRIESPDWRTPNPPKVVPAARQAEYDRLFRRLEVRLIEREKPNRFVLRTTTVWTFDRRGYVWSPSPPWSVREHETVGCDECYRRLKGPWFIYFRATS